MAGYCFNINIHCGRDQMGNILEYILESCFLNSGEDYCVDGIDQFESTQVGLHIMLDYYGNLSVCESFIKDLSKEFALGIFVSLRDWICPDAFVNYYFYNGELIHKYQNQPLEYSGDPGADARIEELIKNIQTKTNYAVNAAEEERESNHKPAWNPTSEFNDDIPF